VGLEQEYVIFSGETNESVLAFDSTPFQVLQCKRHLRTLPHPVVSQQVFCESLKKLGVMDIFGYCFGKDLIPIPEEVLFARVEEWRRNQEDGTFSSFLVFFWENGGGINTILVYAMDGEGFGIDVPSAMVRFEKIALALSFPPVDTRGYLALLCILSLDRRMGTLHSRDLDECASKVISIEADKEGWEVPLSVFLDETLPRHDFGLQLRVLEGILSSDVLFFEMRMRLARLWVGREWSEEYYRDYVVDCGVDSLPSFQELRERVNAQLDFTRISQLRDIAGSKSEAIIMQKGVKIQRMNGIIPWKEKPNHVLDHLHSQHVHFVDLNPMLHPITEDTEYVRVLPFVGIMHYAMGGIELKGELAQHISGRLQLLNHKIRQVGSKPLRMVTKDSLLVLKIWLETISDVRRGELQVVESDDELVEMSVPPVPPEVLSVEYDVSESDWEMND
jgi:hypothetical protein